MHGTSYFVSIIVVIYISASAPFLLPRAELKTIVVSQDNGTNNSTCWNETSLPCKTLDYALKHVTNSTFVLLRSGNYSYNLTEHFNFTNLREIGVVGDDESASVTIECHQNGSLSFESCENITLRSILLQGCGGLHNSTTGSAFKGHYHMPFLSAVFLLKCRDVVVDNCWIVQSPGIGLNMYDVGGDVQISHSWFESNRPIGHSSSSNTAVAGGGVYIEYTYKERTFPSDLDATLFAEFDSNSRYVLHNCTFRNNNASDQTFATMIDDPHGSDHIPFGRGGGLSIFVKGVAKHNVIQITHCRFEDNYALWGGGLFIEFQDEVQNNTLEVKHCTFTNNSAHYAGGAIRSGTLAGSDSQQLLANQMRYEDCQFINNTAMLGGGVSHHGAFSFLNISDGRSLHMTFFNCEWRNNTATMGSAIGLAAPSPVNGRQDWMAKWPKFVHTIVLEDCNITTNLIILTEDKQVIGQGAIYSYSLPIIFRGVGNIDHNNNTAMVIENAVLHFFGNVTFRNNTGGQGGALGLYGTSVLMLMPHSNINFFNNTAQQQGGAIYVRDSGPPVIAFRTTELNTRPCFIAYNNWGSLENITEWQAKVVFKGNQASSGGGKSVYASTLQGCRQIGEPRINNKSLEWPNVFEYRDENTSPGEQISTDPVLIRLNESNWKVSPGQNFSATVELIDEKNSPVLGMVSISITNNVTLDTASDLFLIQGSSSQINNLHLLGKKDDKFEVHATTVAGRVAQKVSKTVLLQDCHPGFEQYDNANTCTCMERHDTGIWNCSADSKHVFLKRGYWGGKIGRTFITYPCPPNYCNFPKHDPAFKYNSQTICTDGRNGTSVLCGACKHGYSVNLGDEKCSRECGNNHLWLLLVFFIVTLLLVLVVLRIELDIFTSYLNAWLYSYQIITFLLQEGQVLDKFISFVIGVANVRVKGFGTCFYAGLTNLEKLGVNYILPCYVLLLLIVLAKLGRCRPACYINRNVSRAFCTLLVLCYTDITMISCNIIHYVPINGRWVLYADGNIEFVRDWKTHLPYTIIACLWFIFFVIFVPLVLLFTPWFLKCFQFLNNFRLFFDTFQKCFKDEYRWFAAYYFICRIYILVIALYVPFGPLKRSILEISSVVIVVTCLYLQPYKTRPNNDMNYEPANNIANEDYNWLNTLDAILLTNLCFIVIFSTGIRSEVSPSVQDKLEKTVNGLAYVPLVYLWCLLCYNGWKYFCPANLDGYQQVEPGSTSESARQSQPI
ncbi:uncharacterized protein LOC110066771 [Orbicella faveolata]|uniref:uncharacterized protein LOC110066771 n=1 Tax=Orbicella faveolata TaxID=48498 RepID=UPI0009E498A0|nr:uncharacterized protein LOC110066771 [Orbicella faveolata]